MKMNKLRCTAMLALAAVIGGCRSDLPQGGSIATKGTVRTKFTEHPDVLVNANPERTELSLRIIPPAGALKKGTPCWVHVELRNRGARVEFVYMPALTMQPVLASPTKEALVPAHGLMPSYGRLAAADERLNFVMLAGGDCYGRWYEWTPYQSGTVRLRARYRNVRSGKKQGVLAWCGQLEAQSAPLKVAE